MVSQSDFDKKALTKMIVHTETWGVGSCVFTIEVTKNQENFTASSNAIPGIVAKGTTLQNALSQFEENATDFLTDFVALLPLKERREIFLCMQDPKDLDYIPESTANKRPKVKKTSASPPHRTPEKTSALSGRYSPTAIRYGEQSSARG